MLYLQPSKVQTMEWKKYCLLTSSQYNRSYFIEAKATEAAEWTGEEDDEQAERVL